MCSDYVRKDNLRYEIAALDGDSIKTELLKNVVNVATYHRVTDDVFGNLIGERFNQDMSCDQVVVVLFNNIVNSGVENGYELLSDPNILFDVCKAFANYRREGNKEILDNIAKTNNAAMYINNEIDTYYTRYGDRPKTVDTTGLKGSGYFGK